MFLSRSYFELLYFIYSPFIACCILWDLKVDRAWEHFHFLHPIHKTFYYCGMSSLFVEDFLFHASCKYFLSLEQTIFYLWIFSHPFITTNWSYGWSRFSTAIHPQPPPPYQPPQYAMHSTMTSQYGMKQPPQAIHLLQNNTREVCTRGMSEHPVNQFLSIFLFRVLNRACHQDLLRECHPLTVNLHPITRCWSIKIDRDHRPTVHL